MCGRRSDCTTSPDFVADHPTQEGADLVAEALADRLPEEPGPFDKTYGYRVTEEGMKALQEYEKHHAKPTLRKVPLAHTVAEALRDEAWRDRQRQRRKEARARGNRLLTVCGRTRGAQEVPELRLLGQWLEQAGFPPGKHCEVEATAGTLTIRAV